MAAGSVVNAAHTPGPWQWENGSLRPAPGASANLAAIIDDDGCLVYRDADSAAWQAECEANRRLMAAAPDLLAAAHAAIAYDAAIAACGDDPDKMASHCTAEGQDLDALYLAWISAARAAIAKTVSS